MADSSGRSLYSSAEIFLLRSPLLPCSDQDGAGGAGIGDVPALAAFLEANPLVEEAVAVASPSLFAALCKAVGGEGGRLKPKDLRRLTAALTKYHLRMTNRPTPFGLFAGVCVGGFADAAEARIGAAHRKQTRPDMEWLARVVRRLEQDPAVLATLRVCANRHWFLRGERIVLRDRQGLEHDAPYSRTEVSVRYTAAVRDALHASDQPIRFPQLLQTLCRRYPGRPESLIHDFLTGLIAEGFLATDLRPPADAALPFEHVLNKLAAVPGHPAADALGAIQKAIDEYERLPVGEGLAAFQAASQRMREVESCDHFLQVDVALNARVSLPRSIARDIEDAAELLWRLSPDVTGHDALHGYRSRFLERYGTAQAVPIMELLSEGAGLGPPDEYRTPAESPDRDTRRNRLLAELVGVALAQGRREIVLDDAMVERLAQGTPDAATAPASLELFVHVAAASERALDAGDYRLALRPEAPSHRAGASFGRFLPLFARQDADRIARAVRAVPASGPDTPNAIHAALVYEPLRARSRNVMAAPQWLEHRIRVDGTRFGDDTSALALDDLGVRATRERFHLVRLATGQDVTATAFHLLNPRILASDTARFLHDLGLEGIRPVRTWDWGTLRELPFLPRVRRGRVILSPASWRIPLQLSERDESSVSQDEWIRALSQWRREVSIPRDVLLTEGDQRIPLRLDDPHHLRILRRELDRNPGSRLYEPPGGGFDNGWLASADGAYAAEAVVPLLRRPLSGRDAADAPPRRAWVTREPRRELHLPGGDWLYGKVFGPLAGQDEVVRKWLPALVTAMESQGSDLWFFIRYADPEPHLRLRFRVGRAARWAGLLAAVHDWVDVLRDVGLAHRLELDGYDPEVERYGGPEAMAAAHRAFEYDSRATMALLDVLARTRGLPLDVVAAASIAELVRSFGGPAMLEAWQSAGGRPGTGEVLDRASVRAAASLITPGHVDESDPTRLAVAAAWQQRRAAIDVYGFRIADPAQPGTRRIPALDVAESLVHMHCNRLLGVDRARERQVVALARAATAEHLRRRRHAPEAETGMTLPPDDDRIMTRNVLVESS